jgi:phage I-like protein
MIAAGEYKYISPVIDWGTRDRATGQVQGATLTSAALTNRPVLDHMPAIQLSDAGWTKA